MKKIAIIYHSGCGHTALFAKHVTEGVGSVKGVTVELITADKATERMDELTTFDGFIFGTPTYMGTVSAPFKAFMDASSGAWMKQSWKAKVAAGFTVSGSPSGDKLNTLITLAIFSAQHGMMWVGNPIMNETYQGVAPDDAANRLGSFLGAMAQAGNVAPETAFVPGDLKTARLFGENFAQTLTR